MKSFTFDCGSADDKLTVNLSQPMAKQLMLALIEQINTGKPVLIKLNGLLTANKVTTSAAFKSTLASHEEDWVPF